MTFPKAFISDVPHVQQLVFSKCKRLWKFSQFFIATQKTGQFSQPTNGYIEAIVHIAPKYLDNIVEIFLGNIIILLKYFETHH